MTRIKRALLGALTAAFPVVLAACYGPPYQGREPMRSGKVVDKATGAGVSSIRVSCVVKDAVISTAWSDAAGGFTISYLEPCDHLFVEDLSVGEGSFKDRTAEFNEAGELVIELEPKAP